MEVKPVEEIVCLVPPNLTLRCSRALRSTHSCQGLEGALMEEERFMLSLEAHWEFKRQTVSGLGMWTEGSSKQRNHADGF